MVQRKTITFNKSKEGKTKNNSEPGSSKGCWMDDVWGAYTPSFRIKQHPLENAGIQIHF